MSINPAERAQLRDAGKLYSVRATYLFVAESNIFTGNFGMPGLIAGLPNPWLQGSSRFLPASNYTFLPPTIIDGRHATYELHPIVNELTLEEVGQFHELALRWAQNLRVVMLGSITIEVKLDATSAVAKF